MKPESVGNLLASVRGVLYDQEQRLRAGAPERPGPGGAAFVTVSRQAGASDPGCAQAFVDRLNAIDPGQWRWAIWDRELIEKVASEHGIPDSLIESIEHRRGWFQEFLDSFLPREGPPLDELQVYRRIASTIRGLARAGRAVIVGRGGVYATRDLPGGVHVRLVAPIEYRIAHLADQLNISRDKAAAEVRRLDADREAFHRRYWRGKALLPELFTITLNSADMTEKQLIDCVVPLVLPGRQLAAPPALAAAAAG